MKRLLFFVLTVLSSVYAFPQVTLYSEDFGIAGNTSFPGNWTTSLTTADWVIDPAVLNGGGVPDCTVPGSSGNSVMAGADGNSGIQRSVSAAFSTIGCSNITVKWNGYRTTGAPTLSFAISTNGTSFTTIAISDVTTDDAWHALATFTLPVTAENQNSVYLRWSYNGDGSGAFIAFDDILVQGDMSPVYYWNGSGPLHMTTSWGLNTDGTGSNPPNFTTNNVIYNIQNNTTATLTGNWSVSGTSVIVSVGNPTASMNLTLPTGFTMTLGSGAMLLVEATSTITLQNTSFPAVSVVTLAPGSTVEYAQTSTVNIWGMPHYNVILSGGADKSQAGNLSILGDLTLNGANLLMTNSSLLNLTLNGNVSGSGTIRTSNSGLIINGSGNMGTLTFGVGSTTQTVNRLIINRASMGTITLGNDLTVTSTFSLGNGNLNLNGTLLTLNGAITLPASVTNGYFTGSSSSSLTIAGAGAITNNLFFDQTSSSTRSMRSVSMSRASNTLTLGNALEIIGTIDPTAGTIAAGSNLTLKSSASAKGRIGIIGATGAFTGSPTVEVFHTAGLTGWVNLCSGGVTGQTMNNWNSSFAITCSVCPETQTGGVDFTSVYSYNETLGAGTASNSAHYIDLGALGGMGTSIDSYTGYWVFLGDGLPASNAITIPLTGGVNTKNSGGNFNLSLTGGVSTENGWNLIANPYPSPILVSQVITSAGGANVDNTILVYDPNTDANVPYTAAGSNSIIPMGQAFMIRALNNGLSFAPNENWKTTSVSNVGMLRSANAVPAYYYDDFMLDLTSASVSKQFFSQAYFAFNGTNNFDNGKDAFSLVSSVDPGTPRIISITGGSEYLKNALSAINGTISIPVKVSTGYAGVYQINPVNLNKLPAGACVSLYDIANNVTHNLKNGAYTATISADAPTNQFELRITVIPVNMASSVSEPVCTKDNTGYIKATGSVAGPWNYTWKDANQNIIRTMTNISTPDTLKNLYAGTYYVDINTVGSCNNASGTFNVNALTPVPVASFSANTTLLSANNVPVSLTNLSTDALSYTWDFGDGTSVNTLHASHAYDSEGSYIVKLIAKNGACNDESTYSMQMDVSSAVVGIKENNPNQNNLRISKDEFGVFAEFNFDEVVDAEISVTNILGQKIATKKVSTDKEKVYIQVPENEKLVFVTVKAGNNSQTKKIVNQ